MTDEEIYKHANDDFSLFLQMFKQENFSDNHIALLQTIFKIGFKRGFELSEKLPELQKAVRTLAKEPMTEKQKNCIDWIEEVTGAVYEGGSVSDFINEHIEEARFQSELRSIAEEQNG